MAATLPFDRASAVPVPLTSFVGREREVAAVVSLLRREDIRLLTLIGPGGVGKTRLAFAVAQQMAGEVGDGVCVVLLGSVNDPGLVVPTIAQALGLRELGHRPLIERLTGLLAEKRLLMVLDNVEHLLPAAPAIVDLLERCPNLKVLVTSRAVLRVSGEHDYTVFPLGLPDPDPSQPLNHLARADAIRLFVDRAQAAKSDFALTSDTASTVAAICRHVDGLPLAIELASARLRHVPLKVLLDRLTRRLPILTGGARDQPARLQTMRAAIAWSYDLLTPGEQTLFRHLAVFAGGFTLAAAEAVGGEAARQRGGEGRDESSLPPSRLAASPSDVLDGIASLVDNSLVRQVDGPGGEPRFTMLETIREFGVEQLEASGEEPSVRARHAAYFLDFVERLWPGWFGGAGVAGRLDLVEIERDNLRAALTWADEQGAVEVAARITHALRMFWRMRGPINEGHAWGERVLTYPTLPVNLRIELLCGAGDLAQMLGDLSRSLALKEEAVALARKSGPPVLHAGAKHFLAVTYLAQNRDDIAERLSAEALPVFLSVGDKNWSATALSNLAAVAWRRGDAARAKTLWEESIALGREIGGYWAVAHTLGELALALADLGDDERARQLFHESLTQLWELQNKRQIAGIIAGVAGFVAASGEPERGTRLCGAVEAVLDAIDGILPPADLTSFQRATAAARSALTDGAFERAWANGRATTLDQAYADALAALAAPRPVGKVAAGTGRLGADLPFGLTRREQEVLRLLAAGHTDREIAEALFVSPRTVMTHVQHIFAKLGVHDRKAAAAFADGHDLV